MTTICIEGPSAAGKSTLAGALAGELGGLVIHEVNELFERPADDADHWYLDRQVDRWQMAIARRHSAGGAAILDGDVFQPLWYGWAYGFRKFLPLNGLVDFYRRHVSSGSIGFADHYIVLQCSEEELRRRRDADSTRRRRNFDEHLQFIAPQRRYFERLAEIDPPRVIWSPQGPEAVTPVSASKLIERQCRSRGVPDSVILERLLDLLGEPPC